MWIQFAFDAHWVNANIIHIRTGSSVKRPSALVIDIDDREEL